MGDFDVKITLDPSFIIGGTGKLQNPDKVGHGYEKPGTKVTRPSGDLTWHFAAKNVIDFAWAADPDYTHTIVQVPDGPEVHFVFQKNEKTTDNWKKLEDYVVKHFQFMNRTFGKYPYEVYSVIQGGDGGMEYPMCTLVLGEGNFNGLAGTTLHEICHSWYQAVLASNESLYPWMDEGFTTFATDESLAVINPVENPHGPTYMGYFTLVRSGLQEPISQHSDHYTTNRAYGTAAYNMGSMLLNQIKYIVGSDNFYKGMRNYYNTWKFRHPEPNDFIRVMEKTSGMQLRWFMSYWVNTTKRIDYGVKTILERDKNTFITLERIGELPMPVELLVTYRDGTKELLYMPLNETVGSKPVEDKSVKRVDLEPWPWVNPTYTLAIGKPSSEIAMIEIDPSFRMADIDRKNNKVDFAKDLKAYSNPTR
ncbi:M1 family metallopeptidase [Oscillatoria amoena NRMC-F 0135]|nr:M1 family metallopeptidase [Oscillatoria amoena NRMC-F 0135]